jgi:hypothetical protein
LGRNELREGAGLLKLALILSEARYGKRNGRRLEAG